MALSPRRLCLQPKQQILPPRFQFGLEARLPVFADLPIQAEGTTEETMADLVAAIAATNHQHPDHDTESWPE